MLRLADTKFAAATISRSAVPRIHPLMNPHQRKKKTLKVEAAAPPTVFEETRRGRRIPMLI
ncbi:MAG: hypothetical protein ACREF9_06735, partial [Opitutaceae bacterium]